jgi:hypothetical protein
MRFPVSTPLATLKLPNVIEVACRFPNLTPYSSSYPYLLECIKAYAALSLDAGEGGMTSHIRRMPSYPFLHLDLGIWRLEALILCLGSEKS